MANLSVGANEAYHTISDAVAASHSGDTVYVQAGTYVNDWSAIDHDLNIIGVGGYAHLVSDGLIDNGKAMLVTNANVTVQNLEFSGAAVWDDNGAGIRHESGNLTVLNSYFHDNQEGILAGDNSSVHITIKDSEFAHNGAGDGQSHGVYVGQVASLTVDGSDFHDTWYGNQLKSRAAETTVTNSHFATGPDNANYDIDLPNGGNVVITNNTFEKGETSDNRAIIHFGGEVDDAGGSLLVSHNTFESNLEFTTAVLNQTDVMVTVSDNTMSGVDYPIWGIGDLVNNVVGTVTGGSGPVIGPAPVEVGDTTPPPVDAGSDGGGDVSSDDPANDGSDAAPPDDGVIVSDDPPPVSDPVDDPAPAPQQGWWAWWNDNWDGVGFTGTHHYWSDWT